MPSRMPPQSRDRACDQSGAGYEPLGVHVVSAGGKLRPETTNVLVNLNQQPSSTLPCNTSTSFKLGARINQGDLGLAPTRQRHSSRATQLSSTRPTFINQGTPPYSSTRAAFMNRRQASASSTKAALPASVCSLRSSARGALMFLLLTRPAAYLPRAPGCGEACRISCSTIRSLAHTS